MRRTSSLAAPAAVRPFPAAATLAVLTLINLLNYLDRYVLSGMLPLVQEHFGRNDAQMGILSSSFLIVYALVSPFTGVLGDRISRRYLIAGGVILWSAATVWSGAARSFEELLLARSLIGIGEAGYAAVAPGLISDLYDEKRRGRMLALFYAALPIGSAIGFTLGGAIGTHYGWRSAFFVAGAPGLLLGLLALVMREPERGAADEVAPPPSPSILTILGTIFRSNGFLLTSAGYTAATFAMGGLAAWFPTFLFRERGLPLDRAGFLFGAVLVVAGFLGTIAGGWLGDRMHQRDKGGHFIASGVGLLLATPLAVAAVLNTDPWMYWGAVFLCLLFLFLNTAPLNATLCNVVPATMRSSAVAVNVLIIHMLGDAISPWLMGMTSDASGSMVHGLLLACAMIGVGGVILVAGAPALRRELEGR